MSNNCCIFRSPKNLYHVIVAFLFRHDRCDTSLVSKCYRVKSRGFLDIHNQPMVTSTYFSPWRKVEMMEFSMIEISMPMESSVKGSYKYLYSRAEVALVCCTEFNKFLYWRSSCWLLMCFNCLALILIRTMAIRFSSKNIFSDSLLKTSVDRPSRRLLTHEYWTVPDLCWALRRGMFRRQLLHSRPSMT